MHDNENTWDDSQHKLATRISQKLLFQGKTIEAIADSLVSLTQWGALAKSATTWERRTIAAQLWTVDPMTRSTRQATPEELALIKQSLELTGIKLDNGSLPRGDWRRL